MKRWKSIAWDSCPDCGATAEVLTDAPEGMACDSDEARCVDCHRRGSVTCVDIDSAYVDWDIDATGEGGGRR